MTTIKFIKEGPSRWDVMLAVFEKKIVDFTFGSGKSMSLNIHAIHDVDGAPPLNGHDGNDRSPVTLLFGAMKDSRNLDLLHVYIEYNLRTRRGVCTILTVDELAKKPIGYIRDFWYDMMDLSSK